MAKPTAPLYQFLLDQFKPPGTRTVAGEGLVALLDQPDGWEEFLHTVGSNTFTKPFGVMHREFFDWYWKVTNLRKKGLPISQEILTFLVGWGRASGKSSVVEWACILEGAMGLEGYVLYVSATQDSANSHVAEIRKRLESDVVARYFPHLANPKIARHGKNYGWREDFLLTEGGWAIRPVGLDVAVRGSKVGDIRPTMIAFDDIDTYKMSLETVEDNRNTIARDILPAGTPNTIKLIAQNLIAEHSLVNQIYTGNAGILTNHIASVYPTFDPETIEIETQIDAETGKTKNVIINADPIWEGVDSSAAQIFINDSGIEAFNAEYQHDFSLDQTEKVIPEYQDFPIHVITWSQFNEKFGTDGKIPRHWQAAVGLDIGYTAEHQSAWTWITVAAEDSDLPFAHFRYRGKCFTGISINEQASQILEIIVEDDGETVYDERQQYVVSVMSHEKKGESFVLNREYEFNFSPMQFHKEDGVPQWRSLLRRDRHQPHPFHEDRLMTDVERRVEERQFDIKLPDKCYVMGRPNYFDVVEDGQAQRPMNDAGLKTHRSQLYNWKRRKVSMTVGGASKDEPMKRNDDSVDSSRAIFAEEHLSSTPLTREQEMLIALKERINKDDLTLEPGQGDYEGVIMSRLMAQREIKKKRDEEDMSGVNAVRSILIEPPIVRRGRRF